jgi:hypothetical protein
MHEDQASAAAPAGSPDRAVVPGSRLCITCDYQLSGLPIDGVCPECSTRVELSQIQLSLLTDPIEHVRTLRRGAKRLTVTLRRDDGGSTIAFRSVTRVGG